jgi:hypothetical protein
MGVRKRGKESPVSKESTIVAIDLTLESLRWAKMRGEHGEAEMLNKVYAELIDLANEVYGTSWIGVNKTVLESSGLRGTPFSLGGNMPDRYEGR